MEALILLIRDIFAWGVGVAAWIGYWIVLPILAYIGLRIILLLIKIEDYKLRNAPRHYGYKGRKKWFH